MGQLESAIKAPLEYRVGTLEKALKDVLAVLDGPEARAERLLASIHGCQCSEEVSKRNQTIIENAYKLLGLTRPT